MATHGLSGDEKVSSPSPGLAGNLAVFQPIIHHEARCLFSPFSVLGGWTSSALLVRRNDTPDLEHAGVVPLAVEEDHLR